MLSSVRNGAYFFCSSKVMVSFLAANLQDSYSGFSGSQSEQVPPPPGGVGSLLTICGGKGAAGVPSVGPGMLTDPAGHRVPEFPWLRQVSAASPLLAAPANVAKCDVSSGTNIWDSCSVLRCPQLLTGLFGFSTAFPTGV